MTFGDDIPREGLLALLNTATEFYLGQDPLAHGMTDEMRALCYPDEINSRPIRAKFVSPPPSRGSGYWVITMNGGCLQREGKMLFTQYADSARYPDAITAMEYFHQWRKTVLEWVSSLELRPSKRHPEFNCRVFPDGHLAESDLCPLDLSFDTLMAPSPLAPQPG